MGNLLLFQRGHNKIFEMSALPWLQGLIRNEEQGTAIPQEKLQEYFLKTFNEDQLEWKSILAFEQ